MNKKANDKVAEVTNAETTSKSPKKKLKLSAIIGIIIAAVVAVAGAITAIILLSPPPTQTVNFNLNGGTGTIASVTKQTQDSLQLPDVSELRRTGYDFVGWATSANATAEDVLDTPEELVLSGKEEVTLYAVWDAIEYTITYQDYRTLNNGTIVYDKNNAPTHTVTYTIEDNLTLFDAARDYTDFIGWDVYTEDTTSSWSAQQNQTISATSLSLGTGHYGNVSLSMNFAWKEYRIIFLSNDRDSLFEGTDLEYLVNPKDESEYVYIRYNDPFWAAYQKDNSEDGKNYLFISEEDFQIPENYDMTITPTSFVYPYDSNITGLKSSKTWKGAISNVNSGASNLTTNYMNEEKTAFVLTAQWTSVNIQLRVIKDGKIDTDTSNYYSNYGIPDKIENILYASTITLPTPTINGYTFVGWYEDFACTKIFAEPNTSITIELTKKTTLYIKL